MLSKPVTTEVIDRLYALADGLAYDWRGSDLGDEFASRMVAAVVRHLERVGFRRPDGTRRTAPEQVGFAEALLRQFWTQNARQQAKRRAGQFERGTRPIPLSIEEIGDWAGAADLYGSQIGDLDAGETGRAVAQHLMSLGWSPERAWALVWRFSGLCWEDVAYLLTEHFGFSGTEAQLRKWGERPFEQIKPNLRHALWDDEPATGGALYRN